MAVVRAVHHVSVKSAQDILEGTDWSSLEHAYGSADQLPSLLPGLLSEDAAVAGRVLGVLDAVLHQGTIYTCTTPTVLFVASILSDPRVEISCESPLPWDERRRPLRAALLEWLGTFAESCTYDDENQAETNAPTRVSQAIRPDLYQAIAPFVWADDPAVRSEARRAATYLLRAPELCDSRATLAEKMLLVAAQTEPMDRVRLAWILDSWGIGPHALMSDPDPAVRACAAAAETLDSDLNALAEIRAALRDPDVVITWLGGSCPEFVSVLATLVRALVRRTATFEEIEDEAFAILRATDSAFRQDALVMVYPRAFPPGKPRSPAQRRFREELDRRLQQA
jgi:hypothetical protein